MSVSDSAILTSSVTSVRSFTSSFAVLRGTMTPGIAAQPSGRGSSTRERRLPSVVTARNTGEVVRRINLDRTGNAALQGIAHDDNILPAVRQKPRDQIGEFRVGADEDRHSLIIRFT